MYGHFRFKRVMVRWLNQFSLNLFGMKKSNETPEFRQDVIETLGKVGHNGTRKYLSRWWNFKYFLCSQSWGFHWREFSLQEFYSATVQFLPWVRTWVPCCLPFKWILQGLPIISKMFESRIFWMCECHKQTTSKIHMGVSKNRGTPKSWILIGFSIINHPFWGTPIFGNTHMYPFVLFCCGLFMYPGKVWMYFLCFERKVDELHSGHLT